jgi:hypothetical protein
LSGDNIYRRIYQVTNLAGKEGKNSELLIRLEYFIVVNHRKIFGDSFERVIAENGMCVPPFSV